MKKNLKIIFFSLAIVTAFGYRSNGQALIHYWNFNTYSDSLTATAATQGIPADYSDLNAAAAQIAYVEMPGTSAQFFTYADSVIPAAGTPDYDTVNAQFGAVSGSALRVRNPSDSAYLLFYMPTTHFNNIVLSYGSESSSATHGMKYQLFDYSVDSGATWRTSGLSIPSDSAWLFFHLTTVTFSDTDVNNNPKMVFRITFSGNDTGTKGNNRFDNVTVKGDSIGGVSISSVANVAALVPAYTVYPNPVINTLDISGGLDGLKSVVILNGAGRNVYTDSKEGKNFSVDVTGLSSGDYFINITDGMTGKISTIKFVKQ